MARAVVSVRVADRLWRRRLPRAAPRARRAALAALAAGQQAGATPVRVDITLAGDAELRRLNRRWRGKSRATNVLSFPAASDPDLRLPARHAVPPRMIGDVIVASGVASAESRAEGKRLVDHLDHLVVHGVLHLLGYDHEIAVEARVMERLEARILAGLGVADPYRRRARAARAAP
jgi:probable rRNA maturation factor